VAFALALLLGATIRAIVYSSSKLKAVTITVGCAALMGLIGWGLVRFRPSAPSPHDAPQIATLADVREATLVVREAHERESERLRVEEMADSIGNGWAVNGLPGTLRRLARGQVRTLLVDAETYTPGFRCGDSGRLAVEARDCRGEGDPVPVIDLVDEAIEEALRQHVQVDVVYDPQAGKGIEGLAGLLRFR